VLCYRVTKSRAFANQKCFPLTNTHAGTVLSLTNEVVNKEWTQFDVESPYNWYRYLCRSLCPMRLLLLCPLLRHACNIYDIDETELQFT
jgi:hypothetical protein